MFKKIATSLIVIEILLTFLQFFLTLGRATDGDRIVEIENRTEQLKRQNEELSNLFFQQTTINRIQEYALISGFVPQALTQLDPLSVAARIDMP